MQIVALPRPPRDTRLDVVKGWLQLTIFFSHSTGSFAGTWLVYGSWGLSDSSEQFIFLSGLVLGSVYARLVARSGVHAAMRDMGRRTLLLYRRHLLVFVLFAATVMLAGLVFPGEAVRRGWAFLLTDPVRAAPAAMTMLFQPEFMGILPIFIFCMLALPGFDWLQRRFGDAALVVPAGLYALARAGVLATPSLAPETGIAFDPFAWQIVFMLGAWFGRRRLLRGQVLPSAGPVAAALSAAAVAVLALGLAARLAWGGYTAWPVLEPAHWVGKETLVPPRLLHGLALAWLVAHFVPAERAWLHLAPMRVLAAIGRHSLDVFCVGLFAAYIVAGALRFWPGREWLDPLLIASGAGGLCVLAWWLDMPHRARLARSNAAYEGAMG